MREFRATGLLRAIEALRQGRPIPSECIDAVAQALGQFIQTDERPTFTFRQNGNGWLIGSPAVHIKTRKTGYKYIHFLLQNPGKQIHSIQVYHLGDADPVICLSGLNVDSARTNIQKRIKAALLDITSHNPEMGQHLLITIHTGIYSTYMPDPGLGPVWQLN